MKKFDVAHFLGLYQLRKEMFESGVTNPTPEGKKFIHDLIDKLSQLPLDEEINIKNRCFFDSKGTLIIEIPTATDAAP
jgi:hypothetical protein